jgi:uncharacterized membrane protein YcaP (DUF421 family)
MGLTHIATRALITYLYLLAMTRMSGKRVVSQATPFDLLVSLIVGDLVEDAVWAEVSISKFAGAVGTIFVLDAIVRFSSHHSSRFHSLVAGVPAVVIRQGVSDRDVLRRQQMNEADLAHLLRDNGIDDRREVRLGIVEDNHMLSVLREDWAEPGKRGDADRVREMVR